MKNNKQFNHPSYGLIQFNKTTGSSDCFMSDVNLGGFISLTVKRAELRRDLSRYWTYPREELLRLRLSYHQFAELITNMNSGCGIPCTLEWISDKGEGQVEKYINPKDERTEFEAELKETLNAALSKLECLTQQVNELKTKGKANKTELSNLSSLISSVNTELKSNIPFVENSFQEALDNRLANIKVETSAWIDNKLISMGMESLNDQIKFLDNDNS